MSCRTHSKLTLSRKNNLLPQWEVVLLFLKEEKTKIPTKSTVWGRRTGKSKGEKSCQQKPPSKNFEQTRDIMKRDLLVPVSSQSPCKPVDCWGGLEATLWWSNLHREQIIPSYNKLLPAWGGCWGNALLQIYNSCWGRMNKNILRIKC